MKRLNWKNIKNNVAEALEQLQEIKCSILKKDRPDEAELYIMFQHLYHNLNYAWNTRRILTKAYTNVSEKDFNSWSEYPKNIDEFRTSSPKKPRAKRTKS